jgi:hypothetical protein
VAGVGEEVIAVRGAGPLPWTQIVGIAAAHVGHERISAVVRRCHAVIT